jgi:hypothetical protein
MIDGRHSETAPTRWDETYNSGRSTQVPTGRVISVRAGCETVIPPLRLTF